MSDRVFDVPDSIEDAVLNLKGLGELITASEWRRAALVWAFTHEGRGHFASSDEKSPDGTDTISQFADRKIQGLKTRDTVRAYRKAWKQAIEDGIACDVKPGDNIQLPDAEWSNYYPGDYRKGKPGGRVGTENVATAIKADPAVREAAYQALQEVEAAEADETLAETRAKKGKSKHKPINDDDTDSPTTLIAESVGLIADLNRKADALYLALFRLREMGVNLADRPELNNSIGSIIEKLHSADEAISKPNMDDALRALIEEETR